MRECREYEALISAAVDGAVTEAERRELMGHLAACAACRETYEQTMLIHEALAGWEAEEPPAALADRVMEKVRWQRRRNRQRRWQRISLAAACLAVAVLGAGMLRYLPGADSAGGEGGPVPFSVADAGAAADAAAPKAMPANGELQSNVTYFESGDGAAEASLEPGTLVSDDEALLRWMEERGVGETGEEGQRTGTIPAEELEALERYLSDAGADYAFTGEAGSEIRVIYRGDVQ